MVTKLSETALESVRVMNERVKDPKIHAMIAKSLNQIDPIYFFQAVAMTLRETPKLAFCDPDSFLGAIIECGQLNLIPGNALKQAHIVPFGKKNPQAVLILGFRGLNTLAYRAGCKLVYADCVHEGDTFDYGLGTGNHNFINHRPSDDRNDDEPDTVTHAWAKIVTPTGGEIFKVMARKKLDAIKAGSPGAFSPDAAWNTHTNSMRQKSPLRFVVDKFAPFGTDLARAAILDDKGEQGIPQNLEEHLAGLTPQVSVPDNPPPPGNQKRTHNGAEEVKKNLRGNGNAATREEEPPPACPPGDSFEEPVKKPTPPPRRNHAKQNGKPSLISCVPNKSRDELTFASTLKWFMGEIESDVRHLAKMTGIEIKHVQNYLIGDSLPVGQDLKMVCTALMLHSEDRDFLTALAYVAEDGDMASPVGHDEQGNPI